MKLREGISVEVFRGERDVLCGSRFSGKLVAGNGKESGIRCKVLGNEGGGRLRPRLWKGEKPRKRWAVGEVAEVFETDSWRAGKVVKVTKNERLVVKLFAPVELKELHASRLRIPRVIPEERCSSNLNDQHNTPRTVNKDKPNDEDLVSRTSNPKKETDEGLSSNECSVASCSLNEPVHFIERPGKLRFETSFCCSDTESSFPVLSCAKNTCQSRQQKLMAIHNLELEAYKSTVQALFASGPLSWEQESLLTNLRLSLHISNDEHLLQVRHLLSA